MNAVLKRFAGPVVVPNADTTLCTVTVGKRWTVKQIMLANADVNPRPITLGIGGVAAANAFAYNYTVQPNGGTPPLSLTLVLEAGESLHGLCGSAFVTVTVSGVEQDA